MESRSRRPGYRERYPPVYTLDQAADDAGTSLLDEIDIAPAFLRERFGPQAPGDGYCCTGRYRFASDDGDVFTCIGSA